MNHEMLIGSGFGILISVIITIAIQVASKLPGRLNGFITHKNHPFFKKGRKMI